MSNQVKLYPLIYVLFIVFVIGYLLFPLPVLSQESGPTKPFDPAWVPDPIYDVNPDLVKLYFKAWQLAWDHVHTDPDALQSPFMDEAFWNYVIWIWDTSFMALFCKYAPSTFPGVESLENFYKGLHANNVNNSQKIQHPDNPPLFAWAEWENYKITNNKKRLFWLIEESQYLQKHYSFINNITAGYLPPNSRAETAMQHHNANGWFWNGVSSGMDNTPRGRGYGHSNILWIDAISQQALSAYYIALIAHEINNTTIKEEYENYYKTLKNTIQKIYWDQTDGFFYDINKNNPNQFSKVKTPASYWPLLALAATDNQAQIMVNHLFDPNTFGGFVPLPTLARSDVDFNPLGQYWKGSMWLPTAYMSIKAIERYGFYEEADTIANKLVHHMLKTYQNFSPRTIWECYSPTEYKPATVAYSSDYVRPDFCGWSALGPISLFIENYLGFHIVDAQNKRVEWRKYQQGRHGIKNLSFDSITTDIIGNENSLTVRSNGPFTLVVNGQSYQINAGTQQWGPNPPSLNSTVNWRTNVASSAVATMSPGPGWGNEASFAIDGLLTTFAQSATPVWDLFVTLDKIYPVDLITLTTRDSWAKEYTIKLSTDNSNWIPVVHETDGKKSTLHSYSLPVQQAKYIWVDVFSVGHTGNWGHAIQELQIFKALDPVSTIPTVQNSIHSNIVSPVAYINNCTINLNILTAGNFHLGIYAIDGKKVASEHGVTPDGQIHFKNNLAPGIYIIKIQIKDSTRLINTFQTKICIRN